MILFLGIRFLIAVGGILVAVQLWFRLFRPRGSMKARTRVIRAIFSTIAVLIVVEQGFLYFYLDKEVQRRREEQLAFLEKVKSGPGGLKNIRGEYCERRRVAVIYSYKLCIAQLLLGPNDRRQERFSFYGIKPAGYLTLLPWEYGDRSLFYGFQISYLDRSGRVINVDDFSDPDTGGKK